jgi:hypothetical protein
MSPMPLVTVVPNVPNISRRIVKKYQPKDCKIYICVNKPSNYRSLSEVTLDPLS